jgi:hypothetical protein
MPQLDKLLENRLATGIVIGAGLAIIVPVAISALAPIARPLARSALRAGAMAYEKARESVAEFGEMAQDVVAEAQEELREQNSTTTDETVIEEDPETA